MGRYYDMKELFGTMVCDTPVPYYDMPVACGKPNMTGDVPAVMMMLPHEIVGAYDVYCTRAEGDSMEGVGIFTGDLLVMEVVPEYRNHDVVLAEIDGEKTLKTYYVFDDGTQWLVPSNARHRAIQLTSEMEVRFCGRLSHHIRRAPQESTRNIRKAIREVRQSGQPVVVEVTTDQRRCAIQQAASLVTCGREWYAVCRALKQQGALGRSDFEAFCREVEEYCPEDENLPTVDMMRRMAVMSFTKPVGLWDENNAPVHGSRYRQYCRIAEKVMEIVNDAKHDEI